MNSIPNKQYNVAAPDSLPVRLATYQRRRMYDRFLAASRITASDTLLDVGVTSDQSYSSSNYIEAWYPHKAAITAVGIDDAAFLETLYPGLRFLKANGLNLPFRDRAFDFVHASAVIEHVGSFDNQIKFVAECARVCRKGVFITTPNRWFPVEFHTVLPIVHWLPKPAFREMMRRSGREFFAQESNLNLMSPAEVRKAAKQAVAALGEPFDMRLETVPLGGWPSNILLIGARRSDQGRTNPL